MLKGLVQRRLRGSIEELTEDGLKKFTDIECELSNHGTLLVELLRPREGQVSKKRQRQMGMVQGC